MKTFLAVSLATFYGVCLRVVFGMGSGLWEVMSLSFLVLGPMAVGFLTVIVQPKSKVVTYGKAFGLPWLTSLAILAITMLFSIEGAICWIMIFPVFAVLAGFGGMVAYKILRINEDDNGTLDENELGKMSISLLLLLPLVFGFFEGQLTTVRRDINISRSVEIAASAKEVWAELTNIDTIQQKESTASFSTMMGFPHHVKTTLDTVAIGGKRKAIYERGLYFDETIIALEPEKKLVLKIKTDPYNIPPTVMDEHILIGGKHLDILEDSYQLEVVNDSTTRLILSTQFYINTPFNGYSALWAKYLMFDILDGELNLIKKRAIHQN